MRVGAVLVLLAIALSVSATELIQNGSFETNGGANSNLLTGWTTVDEAGGSGSWYAQTGTTNPAKPEFAICLADVQPPPAGNFAAMTNQALQGSHILYQDVAIPAGSSPVLSFKFFIRSADSFFTPDSLSYHVNPNQQFRVDVIDPSADLFTLNVLQTVLVVGVGNPRRFGYDLQTATLSGFGGRTVRLRFLQVDNQGCFNAGVDDVHLETDGSNPAPAIIRFTVNPSRVPFAGVSTLIWVTQNATSVEIDGGVGPVPLSGSRSVSLQADTEFTLTATGPGGSAQRRVKITVNPPGPTLRLSVSPSFIQPGQTSTLTWAAIDATDLSIDNGIGAVATPGSLIVTPTKTTEYVLTATGSGVTSTARATVFVDPGDVPIVSVTAFPRGVVQVAGAPAAVDEFKLTNLGRVATNITLNKSGDFFTQSPGSFTLAAGATQVVTITMSAQAPGKYEGLSLPSGTGVPADLKIPVRLFIAVAPTGTVAPTTAVARTEISAPASENPSGSVTFTNSGTGTLQGILISDAAWLIPQSDLIVIGPGETKAVTFTTNRSLRPDASSAGGAATATLTLVYVDTAGTGAQHPVSHASSGGGTSNTISVTIVDVVKPGATPGAPPPLKPGELAFFVPGLVQLPASTGDLFVSVLGNSISDLRLYLAAPGTQPVFGSLDQLAPNAGLALPSVLKSVFASPAPTGTVQARSASLLRVLMSALQTNTAGSLGSFITALPTFRSDRSTGPAEVLHLTGIEKSATRLTDAYVQEVAGLPATAKIELLDAAGGVIKTLASEFIGPFSLLALPDVAPATAVSARITNTSAGAARIVAYAHVIDGGTRDTWIVDSQSSATEQIVAVVPPPVAATNTLYVLNPDAQPLDVTLEHRFTPQKRRAVRPSEGPDFTANVTVGPQQTVVLPIQLSSGSLRVAAARPFVLTARSTSNATGGGTFGTALPTFSTPSALALGESRRFGGVDDSGRPTVLAATPLTYRSNLALIESAGQPATVRLTLRFTFSAGAKITAQALSSLTVTVPANRLLMLNEIGRAVIGASRDAYGDLRNMQLDVEVIGGEGRVSPFVQTIDNGSGDSAIRVQ